MIQRKILILGNEKSARYHPLSHVLFGIRQALKECGVADVNTEYKSMDISALQSYNCILSYIDDYQNLNRFDDVLARYLEQGGRMVEILLHIRHIAILHFTFPTGLTGYMKNNL